MPIPKKPDTVSKPRKQRKKSRISFAQALNNNITQYSKYVMKPGGNVAVAVINYDFCYELTQIFIETLTEIMLINEYMNFDQFGKFEIQTRKGRTFRSPLTEMQDVYVPEFKIIRFYPSRRLKDRIKGDAVGMIKKQIGAASSEVLYADSVIQKMLDEDTQQNENEDKNIIECEED